MTLRVTDHHEPTEDWRAAVRATPFSGGRRVIEHWENFLLTEACGGPPLPDGLAHPVHLFHVPIEGAGVSIAELFSLARAEGPDRVGLVSYDWEWQQPLREDIEYRCDGGIVGFSQRADDPLPFDELAFAIDLTAAGEPVARVTTTWHIWRGTADLPSKSAAEPRPTSPGVAIDPWVMPDVRAERMRTMAAILRDPNPVHWDVEAARGRGRAGHVVNQGPLNVGYLTNMLMAWQGPECLRRLAVRFPGRVFDGDHVTAKGIVVATDGDLATCEVWLERPDGSQPVVGTAVVEMDHAVS